MTAGAYGLNEHFQCTQIYNSGLQSSACLSPTLSPGKDSWIQGSFCIANQY